MHKSQRISEIMSPLAIRIKAGHYIDLCGDKDSTTGLFMLWVRHGDDFYLVDPEDNGCSNCRGSCKKCSLSDIQQKNVVGLISLLNLGQESD